MAAFKGSNKGVRKCSKGALREQKARGSTKGAQAAAD